MSGPGYRRHRDGVFAAIEYLHEARAALAEAADRLLEAECNADAADDLQLPAEAAVLRRAVEKEESAAAEVAVRAARRRTRRA